MRCDEAREKLSAYVDNELDKAATKSVARHVGQCARCREQLDAFQRVDSLVRGLPKIDSGPTFARQVVAMARRLDAVPTEALQPRTVLSALVQFSEYLFDLLQRRETPSTHMLDEFGDFPPLSMGSIYFRILGEPLRG